MDMDAGSATKVIDREAIARALMMVRGSHLLEGGHEPSPTPGDYRYADAVLAVLADQPTVAQVRNQIAERIWEDERVAQSVIVNAPDQTDPTLIHLNGRLMGLQRARDIAGGAE